MEDVLPWWLGNHLVFLAFVAATSFLCLFVGSKLRGNREFWRAAETFATFVGGLSLLLLSFNVEYVFSSTYVNNIKPRFFGASIRLTSHVAWMPSYMCEQKFVKGPDSPSNFDERIADQAVLCNWAKHIQNEVSKVNFSELEELKLDLFAPPPQKTTAWQQETSQYMVGASEYAIFREHMLALKARAQPQEGKLIVLVMAPYLLGLAFAVQLAKVRYKDA